MFKVDGESASELHFSMYDAVRTVQDGFIEESAEVALPEKPGECKMAKQTKTPSNVSPAALLNDGSFAVRAEAPTTNIRKPEPKEAALPLEGMANDLNALTLDELKAFRKRLNEIVKAKLETLEAKRPKVGDAVKFSTKKGTVEGTVALVGKRRCWVTVPGKPNPHALSFDQLG